MIPPEYDSPTWPPELRADLAAKADRAGKPVPVVNPEHIKILWNLYLEKQAERARRGITGLVAVCGGPAENPLGPDVDLLPVGERFTWLFFLFEGVKEVPEHVPDLLKGEPSDSVFAAIASVPGGYMGLSQNGWPFNVEEFSRRVNAA
jgi:hypothetical protein